MIILENKDYQNACARLNILYKDARLIAVDKPAEMIVISSPKSIKGNPKDMGPSPTLADALLERFPLQEKLGQELRYGIVHRLDKDTSGVLLVAKTKDAFLFFQKQFKEHRVSKCYFGLVEGTLKQDEGVIKYKLARSHKDRRKQKAYLPQEETSSGARDALTSYIVQERFGKEYMLVKIFTQTGRKHQVRAHMASLGTPIAGDKLYGFKNQINPPGLLRQFLHAYSLTIPMFNKNGLEDLPKEELKQFISPLPKDLNAVLKYLRAHYANSRNN